MILNEVNNTKQLYLISLLFQQKRYEFFFAYSSITILIDLIKNLLNFITCL
jgi:hypothetical protein